MGETHNPVVPRYLQISKFSSYGIPKVVDLSIFIGKAGLMPKHTSSLFLLQDDASFLIFVTGLGDVYICHFAFLCEVLWSNLFFPKT